jgi:hypothetical protein
MSKQNWNLLGCLTLGALLVSACQSSPVATSVPPTAALRPSDTPVPPMVGRRPRNWRFQ